MSTLVPHCVCTQSQPDSFLLTFFNVFSWTCVASSMYLLMQITSFCSAKDCFSFLCWFSLPLFWGRNQTHCFMTMATSQRAYFWQTALKLWDYESIHGYHYIKRTTHTLCYEQRHRNGNRLFQDGEAHVYGICICICTQIAIVHTCTISVSFCEICVIGYSTQKSTKVKLN